MHIGVDQDSKLRLNETKKCISWVVEKFKEDNVDWVVFCGDLFNSRYSINVNTLNIGIEIIQDLAYNFEKVILIEGNHDTYYKNSNSVNSISFLSHISQNDNIVIVGDYREFVNGNIETFTEEVFHSYGLGRGESENGVILGMSMDDRDYDIYAHGDFGNYAFTDYGKEQLADSFLDNFRRDDWAGGFRDFVRNSGELMRRAKNGEPVDQWISDEPEEHFGVIELFICLIVGLVTGGATVGGMKKQMKTAVEQTRASGYVPKGGVNLRVQSDQFVNRVVTSHRIRREQNRSGGHYGGTTISGSHGGSHHSGKF